MTKKHFTAIAEALHSARPHNQQKSFAPRSDQWCKIVGLLSDTLATFNPAFDRDRFIKACVEGTTKTTETERND